MFNFKKIKELKGDIEYQKNLIKRLTGENIILEEQLERALKKALIINNAEVISKMLIKNNINKLKISRQDLQDIDLNNYSIYFYEEITTDKIIMRLKETGEKDEK